jgi:hypothetical protein
MQTSDTIIDKKSGSSIKSEIRARYDDELCENRLRIDLLVYCKAFFPSLVGAVYGRLPLRKFL